MFRFASEEVDVDMMYRKDSRWSKHYRALASRERGREGIKKANERKKKKESKVVTLDCSVSLYESGNQDEHFLSLLCCNLEGLVFILAHLVVMKASNRCERFPRGKFGVNLGG